MIIEQVNPNSIWVKYSLIVLGKWGGGDTSCLCFDLLIGQKLLFNFIETLGIFYD